MLSAWFGAALVLTVVALVAADLPAAAAAEDDVVVLFSSWSPTLISQ